jgi:hypothetical protein
MATEAVVRRMHRDAIRITVLFLIAFAAVSMPFSPGPSAEEDRLSDPKTGFPSGRLKFDAWVEPGPTVIMTAQARFVVEISTSTWFVEGTRVGRLELSDAVVFQAGQLATNFIRNEKDGPWSVQQWTFFIYPLKEKSFHIPEIRIEATIADPRGGPPLTREINTRPIRLTAYVPEPLRGAGHWFAASSLSIREEYSPPSDGVKVGDAIERRILIEAEGIPAIMLPEFPENPISGLAVYPNPPRLADRLNRGVISAQREERLAYLVEKSGTYRIPERIYTWYDIQAQSLKTVTLPEKVISTTAKASSFPARSVSFPPAGFHMLRHPRRLLLIGGLSVLVVLAWSYRRLRRGNSPWAIRRRLIAAMENGDSQTAVRLFYHWFDTCGISRKHACWREFLSATRSPAHLQRFDRFMALVYGPKIASKKDIQGYAGQFASLMDRRAIIRCRGVIRFSFFR